MRPSTPSPRPTPFWKTLSVLLALPLGALATDNAADLSRIKPVGNQPSDEATLLATAEARIQQLRTGTAEIRVLDRDGQPLRHTAVRVRLVSHEFKLGCNAFLLGTVGGPGLTPELQQQYQDRFAALLNFATLPLYWSTYEPTADHDLEAEVRRMAAWCRAHGITPKGHPLTWHELFPDWGRRRPDEEMLRRQRERIDRIVRNLRGTLEIFDVINEATVSAKSDNAVGRWVKAQGTASVVDETLRLAHQANPAATLLYNDFNLSPDFERLVTDLQKLKSPVNAIGIQSHMHKELWPMDKVWSICETYAAFGLPLHFTELTVLSGRFKEKDDNDWATVRSDWPTTAEGEQRQLEYGRKLYTLLFSHPAVEAVTWWDFSDRQSWTGAPAGLLRSDMTPKPLYLWLLDAFHRHWSTDVVATTDEAGLVKVQAFYGDYEVTAKNTTGGALKTRLTFAKQGPRSLSAALE